MHDFKKKFISPFHLLIVVLVVLIVVGAGVYFKVEQSSQATQQPTDQTIGGSAVLPTARELATWKTYGDTTNGFTFQYPQTWYLEKGDGFEVISNYKKPSQYKTVSLPMGLIEIYITKEDVSSDVTYDSLKKQFADMISWDDYKSQGGVEGKLFTVNFTKDPVGRHSAFIALDGKGHKISISLGSASEKARPQFEQVVSTLKYTK